MLRVIRLSIFIAFATISLQMVNSSAYAVRLEEPNEDASDSDGTKANNSSQSGSSVADAQPRSEQQPFRRLRVLADPPPLPSGGSGADITAGPRGDPEWIELEDFIPGPPPPPMVPSYPVGRGGRGMLTETPDADINFDGVIDSPKTIRPPDTHLAVGKGKGRIGRIVEVTNASVQIWNKDETGPTTVCGPIRLGRMFNTSIIFDPKVLYDQHSDRFFIVALELAFSGEFCDPMITNSTIHIAVSTDGTPDNLTTDWTFFESSGLITIGGVDTWADYPGIGADGNDTLFITTNQFTEFCLFRGTNIRVFDKSDLMSGVQTFTDITYDELVTSGVPTMQPAHVFGTTDSGGFYLVNRVSPTTYRLTHITGHPGAPVATTAAYAWADTGRLGQFAEQCEVNGPVLSTVPGRAMNAVYQTDTAGVGHIYLCFTSDPELDPDLVARTEVVWQDIATNSNNPTVHASGFVDGANSAWTYQPAIAVDEAGNLALSFTQSSSTECTSVAYAFKSFGEAAFFAPKFAIVSTGIYEPDPGGALMRWGDYAGAVRDPDPEQRCFWGAHEYAATRTDWGTRIWRFCTETKGACCAGKRVCSNEFSSDCNGDFRGEGTACPTQNVRSAEHHGTEVVHWVDPSMSCFDINRTGGTAAKALSRRTESSSTVDRKRGQYRRDQRSDACPAELIGVLDPAGGSIVGSTFGSADDFMGGCGSQLGGRDEIFEFSVDSPDEWVFDTCTVPACWDTTLEIREETGSGCPGEFVACDGDGCSVCYYESMLSVPLTTGVTYYLIVDGWSTFAYGDFTVSYSSASCPVVSPCDVWETSSVSMHDTCDVFGGLVVPALSADFFGPGSDPFAGTVCFESDPLGGMFGDADTVIARTEDPFDRCGLPSSTELVIGVEIVELSLRSIAAITVGFNGGQTTEEWDVHVGLSSVPVPEGTMLVKKTHCNGGVWSSQLFVQPTYTFTKIGDPSEWRVLDTGVEGIAPELLVVDAADQMPWVHDLDPNLKLSNPCCTSFFPGIEDPNPVTSCDCNGNLVRDACDAEIAVDCNLNGIPDECEIDCNNNDIPDECDIADCKGDFACSDCNCNGIPDECEIDCNNNGIPDECDIAECDGDPACSDCNMNNIQDECDIASTTSNDCNHNGIPDECDIAECDGDAACSDCNNNSIPDECELGACCDTGNGCTDVPELCCSASFVWWQGVSCDLVAPDCAPTGACCNGEACVLLTAYDCAQFGGDFRVGEYCTPNCCSVGTPTGSDCACATSTCVEIIPSCLGGADEGSTCTTDVDCAVTDPADPGECGNLNLGLLCDSDLDCEVSVATCILQCEPTGVTQLRHPFECHDDIGGTLKPRVDCDPAVGAAACPPVPCTQDADCPNGSFCDGGSGLCEDTLDMTCMQSFTGAYSVARNDTISGDLFTVQEGEACSLNTALDRVGWFELISLPPRPGHCADSMPLTPCDSLCDCQEVGGPCIAPRDCYVLTVGVCCNDPVLTPIWPFLSSFVNCPCAQSADVVAHPPDLDGYGPNSQASLAGRCTDGNYSATFTVPSGEYAYQIYADSVCAGTTIPCDDDDDCPGASCVAPNPDYSVVFTIESCQIAACCVGATCIETNKLDCAANQGLFLGGGASPVLHCQGGVCSFNATLTRSLPEPPARADAPHDILKNRYISVDPRGANGTNPPNMHIRVMVDSSQVSGQVGSGPWWGRQPDADCVSVVTTTKPALEPDWSCCPVVHLTGCPIIPTTIYAIAAVSGVEVSADAIEDFFVCFDGGFPLGARVDCDPSNGNADCTSIPCSSVSACPFGKTCTEGFCFDLASATCEQPKLLTQIKPGTEWFGDTVGGFNGTEWLGPNGVANIDDVFAAILTFQNPSATPGCAIPPCNATYTSVSDIHPFLNGDAPDQIVNISDVFAINLGFQGNQYPGSDLTQCP